MAIPGKIGIAEQALTCLVILLSTGALIGLTSGSLDLSDPAGTPAMQLMWAIIYAVFTLLLIRQDSWIRVLQRNRGVWLLLAFVFASSVWSDAPALTFRRSLALLGSTIVGLYITTRYSMRHYLTLVVIALSVGGVLSLVAIFLFPEFAFMHGSELEGAFRGVFLHRNALGHAVTLIVAICTLLWRIDSNRFQLCAVWVLCVILLVLCASKTALVVSVLVCFNGLLFKFLKSPRRGKWIVTIGCVLTLIAYLVIQNANALFQVLGRDATLTGRTVLWGVLLIALSKHPLLGYGYSAFFRGIEGRSGDVALSAGWLPANAHNGFLEVALDIGLIGLLVFLALYGTVYRRALARIWSRDSITARWPVLFLTFVMAYNLDEASFMLHNDLSWILFVALAFSLPAKAVLRTNKKRIMPHHVHQQHRIAESEQ